MATSSPSQSKTARGKAAKANGTSGRATPSETLNVAQPAASARPSDDEIARRAYEIYEREGRQPGTELGNWLKAEAELAGPKNH
jgi:Protein of unknown function (DUF2934)